MRGRKPYFSRIRGFVEEIAARDDKQFVSVLVRKAEEILEIAVQGGGSMANTAIVILRQGGLRMVDPTGWSMAGLAAEYGAAAVYRVERSSHGVRVEGWNGSDRCLLQRAATRRIPQLCLA